MIFYLFISFLNHFRNRLSKPHFVQNFVVRSNSRGKKKRETRKGFFKTNLFLISFVSCFYIFVPCGSFKSRIPFDYSPDRRRSNAFEFALNKDTPYIWSLRRNRRSNFHKGVSVHGSAREVYRSDFSSNVCYPIDFTVFLFSYGSYRIYVIDLYVQIYLRIYGYMLIQLRLYRLRLWPLRYIFWYMQTKCMKLEDAVYKLT